MVNDTVAQQLTYATYGVKAEDVFGAGSQIAHRARQKTMLRQLKRQVLPRCPG